MKFLITFCFPLFPAKRPSGFQIRRARKYDVCFWNDSSVILDGKSKAGQEKAWERDGVGSEMLN